jgi:redox-sensitive bicupin YhaK (pirin superfamily)
MGSIELIIPQRRRSLGGFEVGRVLPFAQRRMVGPFVFFDHMGPMDIAAGAPRSLDVRPHPHIGLATVTYLFDGEIMHRDSVGSEQAILPGEVNWMVAGRGISHSERFERARAEGGHLHGIQAWVALPREDEETTPSFAHHGEGDLPRFDEPGLRGRLVAGSAFGLDAKVQTFSPMFYLHCELDQGGVVEMPDEHRERAAYVVGGLVEVDGETIGAGNMVLFVPGRSASLRALGPARLMLLGGEPLGERHIFWNFVSSSRDRIAQAAEDWRQGRMKLPDLDHDEFIPLPEDSSPPTKT